MSLKKSHDDEHLDFGKIEQEVHTAVINEEKYWRENDAKFRAVEQRVPTYEDFRDIVLAAHLRPLEKGDKISDMGTFTQVWNQLAQCESVPGVSDGHGTTQATVGMSKTNVPIPKSGQEFVQTWRRLPKRSEDKKDFLLCVGPNNLSSLFKTEVSGGLLGEFLECLQTINKTEMTATIDLLDAFSQSQRFSLSLAFLSTSEKANGISLFKMLKSDGALQDSPEATGKLQALEKLYKF